MGKNRRRCAKLRVREGREEEQGRNGVDRESPQIPTANAPPSMHPDYNPFQQPRRSAFSSPSSKPKSAPFKDRGCQHQPTGRRRQANTELSPQSDWKMRQRNLKKHLVQTLNQAVQTIELWLPEDTSSGFCESDTESDPEDEMDWQHEKETVIPQPCEVTYIWNVCPNVTFERPGMAQQGVQKEKFGYGYCSVRSGSA